jgi:hypothetical protein
MHEHVGTMAEVLQHPELAALPDGWLDFARLREVTTRLPSGTFLHILHLFTQTLCFMQCDYVLAGWMENGRVGVAFCLV